MPKATKLHSKGKTNSIQKCYKADKDGTDAADPEESVREFQLQLCWCIQQLERTLAEKKGNEKQLQEAWKVLTVLKNNNQPIVRKRQLMRTHFGDYRAKMAAEEKKLAKMASKIKISESPAQPKAKFLRKSAFLATGNSSFKFNFNVTQETESDLSKDGNTEADTSDVDKKESMRNVNNDKINFSAPSSEFKFNFDVDNA
ncbi:UPF0488 protein CG14286 [Danaus plexippus]|uniref:Uncharacterized protein n=1 Tax=Danaus plexippus plexippus TaxID=278856 RepID=A0A212FA35_DANPL|nr:UPF0488 protein CG14286 [Danaus plexippus]OWR50590.1 hypothetical protein KGM_205880 [Danaus plexippus plexippus]